jgi:hypothetical protein
MCSACCGYWNLLLANGHSLKLAKNVYKACIMVLGPLTESGATHKAMIHGTSKEVGMALVVMGK